MNHARIRPRRFGLATCGGLLVPMFIGTAFLWADTAGADGPGARPEQKLEVRPSPVTRLASFVTSAHGGPIEVTLPAGRSTVEPMDFLRQHGHLFGVTDPIGQTVVSKVDVDPLGYTHTTYGQVHEGIRVFGGVLKVHQDSVGQILAANGDFFPSACKVETRPVLEAADAARIAVDAVLGADAEAVETELVIVDPGWYGDPPVGARLAYYVIVVGRDPAVPLRDAFFVDAQSGSMLDRWSTIHTAEGRSIHDLNGGIQLPGPLKRFEDQPPSGIAEVDAAYDYSGDTRDYYLRAHGHIGIDGLSETVIASVRWGSGICPNAMWNGRQMIFCPGTAVDDVLAHEYTHGVTEFSAGLIYQNQSGQLNESFSDVFGELVDLFNGNVAFPGDPGGTPWPTEPDRVTGSGSDTPNDLRNDSCLTSSRRWRVSEDPTAFGGAIRDMWSPPCRSDPDTANSPLHICDPSVDGGGVHTGSGVANHAFAIITDGKTFNGYTVTGIGPIKSGAVWYRALTSYLTPVSDFQDMYAALNQAASDLIGTWPNDPRTGLESDSIVTSADAVQLNAALLAVELDTPGVCGYTVDALSPDLPAQCGPRFVIFQDDFEGGTSGWTVSHTFMPTQYDWVRRGGLPLDRPGYAWFCEDRNIGDCSSQNESGTHYSQSPPFLMPDEVAFPRLMFTHYLVTEPNADGGNVKINVDFGDFEVIPPEAFVHNSYNTRPFTPGHPLVGEPSFSGGTSQWGTSIVDLRGFVSGGEFVLLRFDFGKDGCTGYDGWYVDDVKVYDCPSSTDCNANDLPDDVELTGGLHPDVLVDTYAAASVPIGLEVADADGGNGVARAQKFLVSHTALVDRVVLWGAYYPTNHAGGDDFSVAFHRDNGGVPGAAFAFDPDVVSTRVTTGRTVQTWFDEWEITLPLSGPVELGPGIYWVQIYNNTVGNADTFRWETVYGADPRHQYSGHAPATTWLPGLFNLAVRVEGQTLGSDCDANRVPDECDPDCNTNGLADACDILSGAPDCDANRVPDECEFADCNANAIHDACDIMAGSATDCELNGVPDECEHTDCNANGVHDACDISAGTAADCNATGVPDACELAAGTSPDSNHNGVPDECDECLVSATCDDGLFCNGAEACLAGVCKPGSDPCPGQTCQETNDTCVTPPQCVINADCDDGAFCNGPEQCIGGFCQAGAKPCPTNKKCDEAANACTDCLVDADCTDSLFCNGAERCLAGSCQVGANPCTAPAAPVCDETLDVCAECLDDGDCDDLQIGTLDTCVNAACVHTVMKDLDGDGVDNALDDCPNTADGALVDQDGCGCYQLDDDGDGVNNCGDVCPDTPRGQGVSIDGCPLKPPPAHPQPGPDDAGDADTDTDGAAGGTDGAPDDGSGADSATDDTGADGSDADSTPDGGVEPGADVPTDQDQQDGAGASGGTASRRSSGHNASTCGALGMMSIIALAAGTTLLRQYGRRYSS